MRFIISVLFVFSIQCSNSQELETRYYYFNQQWEPSDSVDAVYMRLIYVTPFNYVYTDYWVEKNFSLSKGSFQDSALTIRTGNFELYQPVDTIQYSAYFISKQGVFCNNLPCGTWIEYDLNGYETSHMTYGDDGKLNGTSEWSSRFKNSYYADSTKTYDHGLLHGPTTYYSFGQVRAVFHYTYDKLDSVIYYNDENERIASTEQTDRSACYEGGEQLLQKTILTEQQFSEEAKKLNISGIVKVCFVVNRQGEIEDIEVVESIHPLLDAEAIRIVSVLGYFNPALRNNCEISSTLCLEIKF